MITQITKLVAVAAIAVGLAFGGGVAAAGTPTGPYLTDLDGGGPVGSESLEARQAKGAAPVGVSGRGAASVGPTRLER